MVTALSLLEPFPLPTGVYKGGVARTIFVTLIVRPDGTYMYSESTHAGYSVKDAGTYRMHDSVLVLNSKKTVHNSKGEHLAVWKRHRRLFHAIACPIGADTSILIQERNVLVNGEFQYILHPSEE